MKRLTSFFSMKKLVLGALACAALVLMMPGEAKAATIDHTVTESSTGNGCSWNSSTNTLTLNGATIEVNNGDGIHLNQAAIINLVGDNAITVTGSGYGINAANQSMESNLTITGSGKLTIKVENGCGIFAYGKVTINGVTIEITDTEAHANSKIGTFQRNISIINSNVTINGKKQQ